jgi:hypothetical protein
MTVFEIVRCFEVNKLFSTLGREVINGRLHHILDHTVGDEWKCLRTLLDSTCSILLGSSALNIILYGTSPLRNHELRIAMPNCAQLKVALFFKSLGFV